MEKNIEKTNNSVDNVATSLISPIATLLSAFVIAGSMFIVTVAYLVPNMVSITDAIKSNSSEIQKLSTQVSKIQVSGTGTDTTQQAQQQVTVSLEDIKALWDNANVVRMGNKDAKLIFTEVSDPSCPYCELASGNNPEFNKTVANGVFKLVADGGTYVSPVQEIKKMVQEGKASYVWMYSTGHGNGYLAAEVLYCANDQGKFWEAHDALTNKTGYDMVENTVKNDRTQSSKLVELMASGIDKSAMQKCVDDKKYETTVQNAQQLAGTLGVQGTPGFFVNNKNFAGAYSFTDMKADVDAALQ